MTEVPTTLSPDGRSRPPHLRSFRDGWRHLRFLLLYSPRWLFLYPGLALVVLGVALGVATTLHPVEVFRVTFDVNTLVVAAAAVTIGLQAALFAVFAKVFALSEGFLPRDRRVERFLQIATLERTLLLGAVLVVVGLVGMLAALGTWKVTGFGQLNPRDELRIVVPSVTAVVIGMQVSLGGLFISILGIRHSSAVGSALTIKESYGRTREPVKPSNGSVTTS